MNKLELIIRGVAEVLGEEIGPEAKAALLDLFYTIWSEDMEV